jgi:hypothetical protein
MLLTVSCVLWLLSSGPALAQQDPNDPGLPDSIIVGSGEVDSSDQFQFVDIPVYAVTDDSVMTYQISMQWRAPLGGVLGTGIEYFFPLTMWDLTEDTILTTDSSIMTYGFWDMPGGEENPPPLLTYYSELQIMSFRFSISPNAPRQLVVLDTFQVGVFRAAYFNGWVPRFQPGYIAIGPEVGIDDTNPIPRIFSLAQNYPNPFNSSTTISYTLPEKGPVTLSIYNLLGQKVATLFEGVQQAGEHKVVWEAVDVPSGVYFYRLASNEYVETRKMVLQR